MICLGSVGIGKTFKNIVYLCLYRLVGRAQRVGLGGDHILELLRSLEPSNQSMADAEAKLKLFPQRIHKKMKVTWHSPEYDSLIEQILEKIDKAKNIFTIAHPYADGDAIGSELALYHYCKAVGKNCVVLNFEPIPEQLSWLEGYEVCTDKLPDDVDFDLAILPKDYKVFSNPPFHLSSKIVHKLIESENPPVSFYLILQKQFALKLLLTDRHYTSQLGQELVKIYTTKIRYPLKPTDFTPPPAVHPQTRCSGGSFPGYPDP